MAVWKWMCAAASIALAVALGSCVQETGTQTNPSTEAGASGVPVAGAAAVSAAGVGGSAGTAGAAGWPTAGTGAAGTAGLSATGGAGAGGTSGMPVSGAGSMAAGAGGMAGAGTGGTSGAGTGGMAGAGMAGAGMAGAGMSGAGMGGAGMGGDAVSFGAVYSIISARCGGGLNGCHVTGTSGGLQMPNAATAYDNLVGAASSECSGETRVVPGDADASVLVQAVEGTACFDRMPRGRAALMAAEIATIREWIDGGAIE